MTGQVVQAEMEFQSQAEFKTREEALEYWEEVRREFLERARAAARQLIVGKPYITIDDVREVCPPPVECDPRVMGGVFNTKEWEFVGYTRTNRPIGHRHPIGRFKLTGESHV